MENKILIISSEFPPGPGGIGNHAFNICNELNKRGYQMIINTKSDYVDQNQEAKFDLDRPYKIFRFKRKQTTLQTWIHRLKIIRRSIIKLITVIIMFISIINTFGISPIEIGRENVELYIQLDRQLFSSRHLQFSSHVLLLNLVTAISPHRCAPWMQQQSTLLSSSACARRYWRIKQ